MIKTAIHSGKLFNICAQIFLFILISGCAGNIKNIELFESVYNNDMSGVHNAIKEGANIDNMDEEGKTPLMVASYNGRGDALKVLIDSGADIDKRRGEENILYTGIKSNIKLFSSIIDDIKIQASVNGGGFGVYSIIPLAVKGANEGIKYLLHVNPPKDRGKGETALMIAVLNQNAEAALTLIKRGADTNIADSEGNTPLLIAVKKKDQRLAEMLLKHKADPEMPDKKGGNALTAATETGQVDMAEVLKKSMRVSEKKPSLYDNLVNRLKKIKHTIDETVRESREGSNIIATLLLIPITDIVNIASSMAGE